MLFVDLQAIYMAMVDEFCTYEYGGSIDVPLDWLFL